jgi:glycosyltransferase involved in cell wall biosynthesis
MEYVETVVAAPSLGAETALAEFRLPLVSVIIVNYNYGRFLSEAVASVFEQKYQNIECFLIDNKSTDGSKEVIESLRLKYPSLKITYRSSNDGQCVASAEAFPETKGQYIIFLDADDVLLPDFVGAHVFVSLSLYPHVGFTCSDMYQVVNRQVVLSTSHTIKQLITEQKASPKRLLRPLHLADWCNHGGLCATRDDELLLVSREQKDWRWTATSAFMFRRDAIALLIDNPRLKTLRCALDVYFARGVNVITGSVLIDRPLAVYRMHGSNIFSRHAHLDGCLNFELGGTFDQSEAARRELINFWFTHARQMIRKLTNLDDFILCIKILNDASPRLTEPSPRKRSAPIAFFLEGIAALREFIGLPHAWRTYAAAQLIHHFGDLRETVGLPVLLRWCLKLRLSPVTIAGILLKDRQARLASARSNLTLRRKAD